MLSIPLIWVCFTDLRCHSILARFQILDTHIRAFSYCEGYLVPSAAPQLHNGKAVSSNTAWRRRFSNVICWVEIVSEKSSYLKLLRQNAIFRFVKLLFF